MERIEKEYKLKAEVLSSLPDNCIFFDIETTGLSREHSIIYMIGCGFYQNKRLLIKQWFNDDAMSEESILEDFSQTIRDFLSYSKEKASLFTYNGSMFDLPFLEKHLTFNDLDGHLLNTFDHQDLYKILSPMKKTFGLTGSKQKDWESFLMISRDDQYDGGKLIKVYKDYLKNKNLALKELLYLHNYEDILGLIHLLPIINYSQLEHDELIIEDIGSTIYKGSECLYIICRKKNHELPAYCFEYRIESHPFIMDCKKDTIHFYLPFYSGELKHFYKDYKNYYYLPEEDQAIHKAVGQFVEKEHREKAKANTCYQRLNGIFFPFPDPRSAIRKEYFSSCDVLEYKKDYQAKLIYIEMDQLLAQKEHSYINLPNYLHILFHAILKHGQIL